MKSVCICGSFRFYGEMVQLRNTLHARGVRGEWPLPGPRCDPHAMTADEARDTIMRHLERMERAECLFVCNKGGSLGNSVVMEIGYAHAQRKPVYALAPMHDPFLMPLVSAIVRLEELLPLVRPCIQSGCRSQIVPQGCSEPGVQPNAALRHLGREGTRPRQAVSHSRI